METIQISGLNKKQVTFLNIIWNCETHDQFTAWFESLSESDMKLVDSLLILLQLELHERHLMKNNMQESKSIIDQIMRK